jgi:hypothetical protein
MIAKSPINRFARSINPSLLIITTTLAWAMSCGLISYSFYTLTANILVGVLCALPILLPLWLLLRFIFIKPDIDREIMTHEMTVSAFERAFSEMDELKDDTNN